jgi:hypothetical protein
VTTTRVLRDAGETLGVSISSPEGWETRDLPGGSVAFVGPHDPGEFTPNAVLSLVAADDGGDLAVVTDAVRSSRDGLDDVAILGEGTFEIRGRSWFVTEYAYSDPQAGTVMQAVRVADTGVGSTVRITASSGAVGAKAHLPTLRALMDSVSW